MQYAYLVLEGPHDIEFVGRFLKNRNISRIKNINDLDAYWKEQTHLIPTNFPPDGDLLKRVPVPVFFQNEEYSIALHSAVGDSNIIKTINGTLENNDLISYMTGIGIVMDADFNKGGPAGRFDRIKDGIKDNLELPDTPGKILEGNVKIGVFILPDNTQDGNLETVLIQCAKKNYSEIYEGAHAFASSVDVEKLPPRDRQDIAKPSGLSKATVGCIGNILRPGKAIQVSIQDNRWIDSETFDIPEIKAFNLFLSDLLNFQE